MNSLTPAGWGALLGLLLGILLVFIPFGKVLLIALMVLTGYLIGKILESEQLRSRIREMFSLLFR